MYRRFFGWKPVLSYENERKERNGKELINEEMERKEQGDGEVQGNPVVSELAGLSPGGLMEQLAVAEYPEKILESAQPFMELMSRYRCAMMEVETKLRVLDEEFSMTYDRNPFETIKSRLKKPVSIIEKMKRKGYPLTVEEIERRLNDIAGIRVICSFLDDIYTLADMLAGQDDIRLLEKKDYIIAPKSNGYRSLHLILEVPIFLSDRTQPVHIELQLRTIAMDFWASLEHKLKYKTDNNVPEDIKEELQECAKTISELDLKMQNIHNRLNKKRV